ncbi:MAG: hypothetical protein LUD72_02020 [Bacteroidales bacterium]|nr:hypothetical protein [Bacteroidales bacterium]
MGRTTEQIIKDTIETTTLTNGLLNPEQARRFIRMTFDSTNLRPLIRHEMRTARTGEIDKIGIDRRLLRLKVENTDDGYRAGVNTGVIQYATVPVRLPWEITEETLRENIEGQNFESIVTDLMTTQLGLDMEDLDLNGDTDTDSSDENYDFLKINDGWVKQLVNGSHVVDRSGIDDGALSLGVFYDTVRELPNKYNNGNLRWIMSPHRYQEWIYTLLNSAVEHGGIITDNRIENPASIPVVQCSNLDDDKIILTDPKNLIEVSTYNMMIRRTTEGRHAIMEDKRFYVIHLDFDAIIEELDAACIITGLGASSDSSGSGSGGDTP